MERSYKYRLLPTDQQGIRLLNTLDTCRRLHNACLEQRIIGWRSHRRSITAAEQQRELRSVMDAFPEFKAVQHHVLQHAVKRVDRAFSAFFRRIRERKKGKKVRRAGFPRFKSRNRYRSLSFDATAFRADRDRVILSKVGPVRLVVHRPIPQEARIKEAKVKRDAVGDWWVSFSVELPDPAPKPIRKVVGVDLGLHRLIATSHGETVEAPKVLRRSIRKLRREQRKLSRRKKGGMNRERQRIEVAKVHRTIAWQRSDFLHKVSRKLVDENDGIVFEKLQVQDLQKNRRLSLSMADAGWNELVRRTTYKAEGAGGKVMLVDPAGTSQDCSACGRVVPKDLSVRVHRCACGLVLDRDVNAAQNILTRGLGELHGLATGGANGVRAPRVPREPREVTPVEIRPTRRRPAVASRVVEAGRCHLL